MVFTADHKLQEGFPQDEEKGRPFVELRHRISNDPIALELGHKLLVRNSRFVAALCDDSQIVKVL